MLLLHVQLNNTQYNFTAYELFLKWKLDPMGIESDSIVPIS